MHNIDVNCQTPSQLWVSTLSARTQFDIKFIVLKYSQMFHCPVTKDCTGIFILHKCCDKIWMSGTNFNLNLLEMLFDEVPTLSISISVCVCVCVYIVLYVHACQCSLCDIITMLSVFYHISAASPTPSPWLRFESMLMALWLIQHWKAWCLSAPPSCSLN